MSTLLASDNFNRGDSADLGANWVEDQTGFTISSNRAVCAGTGSARYTGAGQPADNQKAGVLVFMSGVDVASDRVGPGARMSAGNPGYHALVYFTNGSYLRIRLFKGGLEGTQIGSTYTGAFSLGDRIEVRAVGDQIDVLRNGSVIIGPVADGTYTSGYCGIIGVRQNLNSPAAEDFEEWNEFYADAVIPVAAMGVLAIDAIIPVASRQLLNIDQLIMAEALWLGHVQSDQEIPVQASAIVGFDQEIAVAAGVELVLVGVDAVLPVQSRTQLLIEVEIACEARRIVDWAWEAELADTWMKEASLADDWTKESSLSDAWEKE